MQIIDAVRQAQSGAAVENLGRAFGLSPAQADAVLAAVVPELGRWFERNTLSRGGLADLVAALGQGHHQAYLDDPRLLAQPQTRAEGDAILAHVLGSKDISRGIAERASALSGVPSSVVRMMVPVIMSMVMGGLAKSISGGLGDILGRLGRGAARQADGGGLQMPRLPDMPDGGGVSPPSAGDGGRGRRSAGAGDWDGPAAGAGGSVELNPDGGLRMPDGLPDFGGGAGLPMPRRGADNPYGDLADILRRGLPLPRAGGGVPAPRETGGGLPIPRGGGGLPDLGGAGAPVAGGLLWKLVRGLIGSAFGFQGRGLMGWIIRMVLMRWGWAILRRLFGGALGR